MKNSVVSFVLIAVAIAAGIGVFAVVDRSRGASAPMSTSARRTSVEPSSVSRELVEPPCLARIDKSSCDPVSGIATHETLEARLFVDELVDDMLRRLCDADSFGRASLRAVEDDASEFDVDFAEGYTASWRHDAFRVCEIIVVKDASVEGSRAQERFDRLDLLMHERYPEQIHGQ